jgi:hypothetical protein
MAKPPRAQELNAPILRLARDNGMLADKELHGFLALEFGLSEDRTTICSVDQMLFSASVNLAKRRLVRYGLLKLDGLKRVTITAQGELFLARGLTRLDARTRRCLDDAWRTLALAENASDDAAADDADTAEERSVLAGLLAESEIEYHDLGGGHTSVPVWSRLRSWDVDVHENDGWICMRAFVMTLPAAPAARAALVDAAMKANGGLTVWRFALGSASRHLFLEAEYRADHLDGAGLAGLVSLVGSVGDALYEKLVKVALAPAPLDALEDAFKRSA